MNSLIRRCGVFSSLCGRHAALMTPRRHLPICCVDTSLPADKIPDNLPSDLVSLVAKTLNKPVQLVSVIVRSDLTVVRGDNPDPSVFLHLSSVGVFDPERNPGYSKVFIEYLMSSLNMPFERVAVIFNPIERHQAGHLLYSDMKNKK